MKNAIQFDAKDNVAVALEMIEQGETVRVNGGSRTLSAAETIPLGQKLALEDIALGMPVIKYGHVIGTARAAIARAALAHVHNVADRDFSQGRAGRRVWDAARVREIDARYALDDAPALTGYHRANGMVGFRNHLLVLSTVVCANQLVERIGLQYADVIAVGNPSGCVVLPNEAERLRSVLLSLARNPNVGGVVFVGLGCETTDASWFAAQMQGEKPAAFVREQDQGSSTESMRRLETVLDAMRRRLSEDRRTAASVRDIRLGTKCGGSDWTTAVVSNPAIGVASDIVVKNGGISLLGETCGWFGGEEALIGQARSQTVADGIASMLDSVYARALSMGRRIEEGNPTPGNNAGGITTLAEKALGNVKKGGTAPIEGVLQVGEAPTGHGLYVCDNPGLDPVSLLGLSCASMNILLFSTGRGTPTGTPVVPAIKLTGSPEAGRRFGAHMDVSLLEVTQGSMSTEQAGRLLFDEIIAVANGKETVAERLRHREYAFPLLMGPL